jgi:hypothetical protein
VTIGTDTLAQDSFNRSNGTLNGSTMSDAVNTWTTVSGTCSVASNKETGAGVARVTSNSGIGNANYSVQAEQYMKGDVSVASDGVDGILTLFARYVDSNNFYYATIQCAASNYEPLYYNIGKVVSGSHTSLTSGQEDDTGGTTWRFDADGTSLKLFKGGSQVLSTTDSAITGTGYPALSSGSRTGSGGATYSNDNFIVKGTTASGDTNVSCSTEELTLTTYPATVNAETNVLASTEALTLTTYPATITVTSDTNISASTEELTLTTYPATIVKAVNVQAITELLTLTTYPATIQKAVEVLASTELLTLTTYPATISTSSGSLSNPQATMTATGWSVLTIDVAV